MGGAKWPVLILINHRIEFPNQSKWMANIFALFIHHTQNASYNHHYHNIILNYRCDFRQILRCITTTGHKAGFRWSAVHLFTMYQFICIVVPIDCWAAAIWWLRSLSLFNQTGRCFATTGISLFIIRHSIIMRRWSWFVDKQLKCDAERPSPININELHRIHRNVLSINLCSNQPKFTLSLLSNSICLHWILFSGFCLGKPNLCSYWKCTNTLWHCLFDTALRINDSNVCYHYRSSSSIALRGWCIKNHIWINTQHTRSMAMINGNPVWRMSIFMFDSHCLLLLIWSNKCKHYAKRVP